MVGPGDALGGGGWPPSFGVLAGAHGVRFLAGLLTGASAFSPDAWEKSFNSSEHL